MGEGFCQPLSHEASSDVDDAAAVTALAAAELTGTLSLLGDSLGFLLGNIALQLEHLDEFAHMFHLPSTGWTYCSGSKTDQRRGHPPPHLLYQEHS